MKFGFKEDKNVSKSNYFEIYIEEKRIILKKEDIDALIEILKESGSKYYKTFKNMVADLIISSYAINRAKNKSVEIKEKIINSERYKKSAKAFEEIRDILENDFKDLRTSPSKKEYIKNKIENVLSRYNEEYIDITNTKEDKTLKKNIEETEKRRSSK